MICMNYEIDLQFNNLIILINKRKKNIFNEKQSYLEEKSKVEKCEWVYAVCGRVWLVFDGFQWCRVIYRRMRISMGTKMCMNRMFRNSMHNRQSTYSCQFVISNSLYMNQTKSHNYA